MENNDLISMAAKAIRAHKTPDGYLFGDVGAALLAKSGKVFVGVCADTPSWGICAERSAAVAMISSGEYEIAKIVAVWRKPETGELYVLPPCGHCREFLRNVSPHNLQSKIILGCNRSENLSKLLPESTWPKPLDPG